MIKLIKFLCVFVCVGQVNATEEEMDRSQVSPVLNNEPGRSELIGGHGGIPFELNIPFNSQIDRVLVRRDAEMVYGLGLQVKGNNYRVWSSNTSEGYIERFDLQKGEYLTQIKLTEGYFGPTKVIMSAQFFTSKEGRSSPIYGKRSNHDTVLILSAQENYHIASFFGRSDYGLDAVGVIRMRNDQLINEGILTNTPTPFIRSPLAGGETGNDFELGIPLDSSIEKILVKVGVELIGGIGLKFRGNNSYFISYGKIGLLEEFPLGEDEYLVKIEVGIFRVFGIKEVIRNVRFTTSKGRVSERYGSAGIDVKLRYVTLSAEPGYYIANFYGRSDVSLESLGVLMRPIPLIQDEEEKKEDPTIGKEISQQIPLIQDEEEKKEDLIIGKEISQQTIPVNTLVDFNKIPRDENGIVTLQDDLMIALRFGYSHNEKYGIWGINNQSQLSIYTPDPLKDYRLFLKVERPIQDGAVTISDEFLSGESLNIMSQQLKNNQSSWINIIQRKSPEKSHDYTFSFDKPATPQSVDPKKSNDERVLSIFYTQAGVFEMDYALKTYIFSQHALDNFQNLLQMPISFENGMHDPEPFGIWTSDHVTFSVLRENADIEQTITVSFEGKPEVQSGQYKVTDLLNHEVQGNENISPKTNLIAFDAKFKAGELSRRYRLSLTDAESPASRYRSEDTRVLGWFITALSLEGKSESVKDGPQSSVTAEPDHRKLEPQDQHEKVEDTKE